MKPAKHYLDEIALLTHVLIKDISDGKPIDTCQNNLNNGLNAIKAQIKKHPDGPPKKAPQPVKILDDDEIEDLHLNNPEE